MYYECTFKNIPQQLMNLARGNVHFISDAYNKRVLEMIEQNGYKLVVYDDAAFGKLSEIIKKKYPDYLRSFDKICKQRWGYMFNMMVMEKELFSSYCEWLFNILFELRKRLGEDGLTPFHSRYYGRISEIIFNAWLDEQVKIGKVKIDEIKEIPLIHMEKINWWKKGTSFLKAKFMGKKYSGSF